MFIVGTVLSTEFIGRELSILSSFHDNSLVPISLQARERGERMQHSDLCKDYQVDISSCKYCSGLVSLKICTIRSEAICL